MRTDCGGIVDFYTKPNLFEFRRKLIFDAAMSRPVMRQASKRYALHNIGIPCLLYLTCPVNSNSHISNTNKLAGGSKMFLT